MAGSRAERPIGRSGVAGHTHLAAESLEGRIVLAAGIGFDRGSRTVTIVGSAANDIAEVRQQGSSIVLSLSSASGRLSRTVSGAMVSQIVFTGRAGNDTFRNLTAIPSHADGGAGADVLRGGSAADRLIGGDGADSVWGGLGDDTIDGGQGNDSLFGEDGVDTLLGGGGPDALHGGKGEDDLLGGTGNDRLDAGEGDDRLNGEIGSDQLIGGAGLDREVDLQDRFADGDVDGDGFDNDYDSMDIFYENGGPSPAYADDVAVAATIEYVGDEVRNLLGIPAGDAGLRVRVSKDLSGDRVSGVWRYLTPDKIQVWAKWCYPASDPTQFTAFAQYSYTGPYSGNVSDYTNPANYVVSEESRLYAGYLSGATAFINWLPQSPVGFFYSAPNEQATGFPAPIEPLKDALRLLPNFSNVGDSFQGTLSTEVGFRGVQPVLDLLRTINQVNQTWYARLRAERLAGRPAAGVQRLGTA